MLYNFPQPSFFEIIKKNLSLCAFANNQKRFANTREDCS
jgi:hypothetical protein